jgi:hypothetical protein
VVQVSASGDIFSVGDWDFKAASFSGLLDDTASDITVVNAGKTDTDNSENITTGTVTLTTEVSGFLIGTLYRASGADERLVNGENELVLEADGTLTLPSGGTISEGYVTSNPTIQLTPASPSVASQKLVIKGGGSYSNTENGIYLSTYNITWAVSDTVEFNVYDPTRADETLYWWIVPEGAGISTTTSGTVTLDGIGDGTFTFTLDSDAYEFRVRVSPEDNNYDPNNTGVESVLINGDEPTFEGEHHLHLTTGDLSETSIFLGTDDHNVRTTVDGGISMTTIRGTVLFGNTPEQCVPTQSSHFHIMRDDPTTVDLFFGDDFNYVKLPYDSTLTNVGVQIGTDATNLWSFGTDGVLTFPSGNLSIGNALGSDAIVGNTDAIVGVLAQGQYGTVGIQWIDNIENIGSTSTQTLVAAVIVSGPLASTTGTVQIVTGFVNTATNATTLAEHTWEFGTDGITTFPDGTTSTGATVFANSSSYKIQTISFDGSPSNVVSTYEFGIARMTIPSNGYIFNEGQEGYWALDGVNNRLQFPNLARIGYGLNESLPTEDDLKIFAGNTGSVYVSANGEDWQFGNDGTLTFPDATVQTTAFTGTGAITFTGNEIEGNTFDGTGTIITKTVDNTGDNFSTGSGSIGFLNFGADGTIQNVKAGWTVTFASGVTRTVSQDAFQPLGTYWNISFDSAYIWSAGDVMPVTFSSPDYVAGTDPQVTLTAGTESWIFDNTGDLTLPAGGNIVDSTGVNQTAQRVEGTWTVTTGTNTYNFTVPMDGTYVMWVKGNIPNGIITWNATVSVSNTNVPAIGTQYAWNYTGGGSPILLTAMPDQIRGTAGSISTDATYAGTTSNTFDFTIANTSGESQTVYYGYTKI